MAPKIDSARCQHRTLHAGRFDGGLTVCLDCESQVHVSVAWYASDRDQRGQYHDGLVRCEADVAPKPATFAFHDPMVKTEDSWRVSYEGEILAPSWNSKGAAEAYLDLLRRGQRKPEWAGPSPEERFLAAAVGSTTICPMHGRDPGDRVAPGTVCNGVSAACKPHRRTDGAHDD